MPRPKVTPETAPLGLKLEDLIGRVLIAFMACKEGDGVETELLQARYHLERARAVLRGADPDRIVGERMSEWEDSPDD